MMEDNEKKVLYLADVLEKYIQTNDLKVPLSPPRKSKTSKGCPGREKSSLRPNNLL